MKALDDIEASWTRVTTMDDHGTPEYAEAVDESVRDVPQLVKALRAVLELHVSDGESQGYTPDGYRVIPSACSQCGTPGEYGIPWPCATVRAIESALAPRPQITNEQVEAGAEGLWWSLSEVHNAAWEDLRDSTRAMYRRQARAALEAAAEVQR
ncbi:hypothetical protein [Propionimicrobium sp. PCR01-08-3]|uniref:hypothetical protein n=1 Tax=Propionimicrobium sp. PCR01-08-3 TaxID=3052086 RepID=UPI00255C6919|nr:hypothetical protein [Propionimicrobium sp. PCR01-08-3]WIY84312.1 hypothetical protein QQ658_15235 [Propionimicrobium sp. PCR01-08-3]